MIKVEQTGGVTLLTLAQPKVMNRFGGTMREDLLAALHSAAESSGVRVVMITGAGNVFSAGADIEEMIELHRRGDLDTIARRVDIGADVVRTIRGMPKPVIAAVNGTAAGAGVNLALACDVRLGSDQAAFVESFVRIGLIPDWGGLHSLVRLVGPGRAADLAMTGDRVDAERAERLGLLDRVYPDESFAHDSMRYASELANGPSGALAAIKSGIGLAAGDRLDEVLEYERRTQVELFGGDDCLEGMQAFLGKRRPHFGGRSPVAE